MSRIRIVEGSITKTTKGVTTIDVRGGDFIATAGKENNWNGKGGGMSHLAYDPAHKDDTLSTSINVSLNLFFDGTQNNKTNTDARKVGSKDYAAYIKEGNKNDDSFENDYTNVARGYDAVDSNKANQIKVYIEGIGTENLKSDSILKGVARGEGDTGIEAKVSKGCMDAAAIMKEQDYQEKNIDILYVNVYGFSRGAAAARHFIHVASKKAMYSKLNKIGKEQYRYLITPDYPFKNSSYQIRLTLSDTSFLNKYGYFGACLLSKEMKIKEIKFNFVGIYDTVSSHGLYHGNDVSDLNLDSITKARYVFHLASDDEYRDNFDLINIKSAGLRGLELTLPGVHSDIGGSYLNNTEEISVLDNLETSDTKEHRKAAQNMKDKEYEAFKKIVVNEGWYSDAQLTKQFFYEKDFDKFTSWYENHFNYGLVGRRKLSNAYDKIPLNFMIERSKAYDVYYTERSLKNTKIDDSFIASVDMQLEEYFKACATLHNEYVNVFNKSKTNFSSLSKEYTDKLNKLHYSKYIKTDDLKKLRKHYLHWSVKSNLFGLSARKEGALPQEKRKREIHNG